MTILMITNLRKECRDHPDRRERGCQAGSRAGLGRGGGRKIASSRVGCMRQELSLSSLLPALSQTLLGQCVEHAKDSILEHTKQGSGEAAQHVLCNGCHARRLADGYVDRAPCPPPIAHAQATLAAQLCRCILLVCLSRDLGASLRSWQTEKNRWTMLTALLWRLQRAAPSYPSPPRPTTHSSPYSHHPDSSSRQYRQCY